MTNIEHIENFCVDYFNQHDLNPDDEKITKDDIYIMSYEDFGLHWKAVVYTPYCIYELALVDEYDTVEFNKYKRCGGSLLKWEG